MVAASQGLSVRYRDPAEIQPAELQGFKAGLTIASAYDPKVAISDDGRYLAVLVEQSLGFVALPGESNPRPKMFTHLMSDIHDGYRGAEQVAFAKTWNGLTLTTAAGGAKVYRLAWSEDLKDVPRVVGSTPAGDLNAFQALSPGGNTLAYCYFNGGASTSVTICPLNIDYVYAPTAFEITGSLRAVQFNQSGSLLAAGSTTGHLHVHSAELLSQEAPISTKLKEPITSVGFGRDNTVFAGTDAGSLVALKPGDRPNSPVVLFDLPISKGTITAITTYDQDSSVLVGTSKGEVFHVNREGTVQLLGKCPEEKINSIATSADGKTVAIGLFNGGALVFNRLPKDQE
jgi:WD40 repeat protein